MKKTISILMAFVIALSVCAVMTFASDSGESLIGDNFVLVTGADKDSAKAFAMGETVYGKVEGDDAACYKVYVDAAKNVDFSFRASSNIEVTIEKADGTDKTILSADKSYDKTVSLSNAYYYITVKNYAEPVTEEATTEEAPAEEESSANIDNDMGSLQLLSAQADEAAVAEYYFRASCENMPAAYVKINHKEAELVAGESLQLKLSDCTVENLNHFWRVYDDPETKIDENEIATVTSDGLVTIKMNNSFFTKDTVIKVQAVMYYDNVEATKTCTITAVPANIFLDPYHDTTEANSIKLGVGAYRSVSATTNVDGKSVIWSSSDENVATVSPSGKITATGIGKATLKATIEGTGIYRAILVDVADGYTSVMGVTFGTHSASVRANENIVLEYGFKTAPEDDLTPSNSKVTFTSSNPEVATVDVDGKVTGVAEGTATITITTEDGGYTDECKVTVTAAIPNWLMVIIAPIRLIYNLILLIIGG